MLLSSLLSLAVSMSASPSLLLSLLLSLSKSLMRNFKETQIRTYCYVSGIKNLFLILKQRLKIAQDAIKLKLIKLITARISSKVLTTAHGNS